MVISKTSAVEVSIQAVSPLLGAHGAALLIRSMDALSACSSAVSGAGVADGAAGAVAAGGAVSGEATATALSCAYAAPATSGPNRVKATARLASPLTQPNGRMKFLR